MAASLRPFSSTRASRRSKMCTWTTASICALFWGRTWTLPSRISGRKWRRAIPTRPAQAPPTCWADCSRGWRGTAAAQVLVGLLARLGRYREAIETSLEHLRDADLNQLACPSVMQLCQLASDYDRLMDLSREQNDLLGCAAALLQR